MSQCPLVREDGGFGRVVIRFNGDGEANREAAAWLSEEIGVAVPVDGVTEVGVGSDEPAVENFWYWLEPYAASHPGASFVIEGNVVSYDFDECFRVEVMGGGLVEYRSGWYIYTAKSVYDSYEDFCERNEGYDDNPPCTRDEYDAMGEDIYVFLVDGPEGTGCKALGKAPLRGPATTAEELVALGTD